jgi:hypothetical protein
MLDKNHKEAEFWKDVTECEVNTGHFMVPFQCVPDGTKEEHRAAELGWSVSGHKLEIKSPYIQAILYCTSFFMAI